jgi:hypothetical protein
MRFQSESRSDSLTDWLKRFDRHSSQPYIPMDWESNTLKEQVQIQKMLKETCRRLMRLWRQAVDASGG